jgi:hypothetical protein
LFPPRHGRDLRRPKKDGNGEKEGIKKTTISTRLGIAPAGNFEADVILRYVDAESDLDNAGGAGGDDPNNKLETKQLSLRAQSRLALFDDLWEQKLGFSLSDQSQDYGNGTDAGHPSDLERSAYDGQTVKFDWQHNLRLHKSNTLTLGVETEKEKASSTYYSESVYGPYSGDFPEKTARTTGYYLQDRIRVLDAWFTTLGVRLDDHDRSGRKPHGARQRPSFSGKPPPGSRAASEPDSRRRRSTSSIPYTATSISSPRKARGGTRAWSRPSSEDGSLSARRISATISKT